LWPGWRCLRFRTSDECRQKEPEQPPCRSA
jgi:hypothetical protein